MSKKKDDLKSADIPTLPAGKNKIKTGERSSKNSSEKPSAKDLASPKKPVTDKPTSIKFTAEELDEIDVLIEQVKSETGLRRCNRTTLIRASFFLAKGKNAKQIADAIRNLD